MVSDNATVARAISRMLDVGPFQRLKEIDQATLLIKLEAMMPFIGMFSRVTCSFVRQGQVNEAVGAVDLNAELFAESLNIPREEGRWMCIVIVMFAHGMKGLGPFLEVAAQAAEKERWMAWFEGIWAKEAGGGQDLSGG